MAQCPSCGNNTLIEKTDILPPPPQTNWAPQPRKWQECGTCGYDSRKSKSSNAIPDSDQYLTGWFRRIIGLVEIPIALALGVGGIAVAFSSRFLVTGIGLMILSVMLLVEGVVTMRGKWTKGRGHTLAFAIIMPLAMIFLGLLAAP